MHPDHRYKHYTLRYDPPPIPTWTEHAWFFWHDDYDGAPDGVDYRHGTGSSVADCARQIDEIEAEQN